MKPLLLLLCIAIIAILPSGAFSSGAERDNDWIPSAEAAIAQLNQQLETFDVKKDDAGLLAGFEKQLSAYKERAQKCVDEKTPKIEKLASDIEGLDGTGDKVPAPTAAAVSLGALDQLAADTEAQLKACKAILLNSQNLIATIGTLEKSILTDYLLLRGKPLSTLIRHNSDSIEPAADRLHDFLETRARIVAFDVYDWSVLGGAMLIAWLAGILFGKRLRLLSSQLTNGKMTEGLIAATYACLGRSLPLLLASIAATTVVALELPLDPIPFSLALSGSFTIYLLAIIAARILLHPSAPAKYYFALDADFAYSLYKRLQFLLVLGLVALFSLATGLKDLLTQGEWELCRAGFMALTIVNLVWLATYLNRAPGLLGNSVLRSLVSIALLIALGAEIAGYRNFAGFLYQGTIYTIMLGIALWLIYALLHDLLDSLDEGRHRWGRTLRDKLHLEDGEAVPGVLWIRLLSVLMIWMFFVISMMQVWRYSDSGWEWVLEFVKYGFEIGSVRIVPSQIALGIALFALLLTVVRWFLHDTLPRWVENTSLDHGGREALVTISGYVGVLLAVLVGLSIAGFDFTNLALIAGALSVGIGFGLQNIVNNFVSGLILLFERPIRTGDWIVVGGTEGYVRKISIRSTQIETFDRADVLVPNAELISGQVTNWMLNDPWGRVVVPVGVAYGSDVRKVEELLIACAMEHPLVLKEHERVNPPTVLFRGFGDSSLDFELRAFISEVNKRLVTLSDLNFAIEKTLRENGIEIPYPQHDLHLRSVDPSISLESRNPAPAPEPEQIDE